MKTTVPTERFKPQAVTVSDGAGTQALFSIDRYGYVHRLVLRQGPRERRPDIVEAVKNAARAAAAEPKEADAVAAS